MDERDRQKFSDERQKYGESRRADASERRPELFGAQLGRA